MLNREFKAISTNQFNLKQILILSASFLNILFFINICNFWIAQYFSNEPVDYIKRLSFIIEDIPWMPPEFIATPYFGFHYFGDWQLAVAFAKSSNPYTLDTLPSQTPPLGTFLIRTLTFFFNTHALEIVLFIIINLIFIGIIYFKIIHNNDLTKFEIIYIISTYLLQSTGFFLNIDRGSMHFWTYLLLAFSIISMNKSWKLSLVFFIIAVSLKPQILITLLFFIRQVNFKIFLKWFLILYVTLNIVTLYFYSGIKSFLPSIIGLSKGLIRYTSNLDQQNFEMMLRSTSFQGAISTWLDLASGPEFAFTIFKQYNFMIMFFMVILFIIVISILLSRNSSLLCRLILIFSMPSYFVAISPPYNLIWIPALVLLFFMTDFSVYNEKIYTRLDLYFFIALIMIGIPINSFPFTLNSTSIRYLPSEFLIPTIITVFIIINYALPKIRQYTSANEL